MSAWISILGLYEYDPTIFDGLILPTAADITTDAEKVTDPWVPDKTDFINYICMELAEVGLVYGSAPVMASMIAVWSKVHIQEWIELYNTLLYKYNPIWNKDGKRIEDHDLEWTDYRTADLAGTNYRTADLAGTNYRTADLAGTDYRTADLDTTDTRTYTNLADAHSGDIKHNVTGYDSNTYSHNTQDEFNDTMTRNGEDKNIQNIDGTDKHDMSTTGTDKYDTSETGTDKYDTSETGTDKHDGSDTGTLTITEQGNIGVTSTQSMIKEQREIVQFNLYEYMLQSFKKQFCVMVY